jgi:hypothetical protein
MATWSLYRVKVCIVYNMWTCLITNLDTCKYMIRIVFQQFFLQTNVQLYVIFVKWVKFW